MAPSLAEVRDWLGVATGVVALCAFVVGLVQLRLLLRNAELQTNLAVIQAERSVWQLALVNPDLAPAIMKERWGESVGGERLFACMLFDHYEGLYFQHRRGAIPRAYWDGIERRHDRACRLAVATCDLGPAQGSLLAAIHAAGRGKATEKIVLSGRSDIASVAALLS